ncbi:MAG: type II toxin-antitoxin system VapC family toxin [Aestuariivirga sp.]
MIIVDTNVVSEVMRPRPFQAVMDWLEQNDKRLAMTSVTVAELSYGIERIRPAERAPRLSKALESVRQHYDGRMFAFDEPCAMIYGKLMGEASRRGRTLQVPDGMIAAVAIHHRAALATRNVADFEFLDLQVINPWGAAN